MLVIYSNSHYTSRISGYPVDELRVFDVEKSRIYPLYCDSSNRNYSRWRDVIEAVNSGAKLLIKGSVKYKQRGQGRLCINADSDVTVKDLKTQFTAEDYEDFLDELKTRIACAVK